MMISIRELMATSPLSRLECRVLLSHVTGLSHAALISRDNECLSQSQLEHFQQLLCRAQSGEPLAYLTGTKEFYSREFQVTRATLIPRPETELLVDYGCQLAKPQAHVLELGTGSGCIAITLKLERPDLHITAVDISGDALAVANRNAASLAATVNFCTSNWYSALNRQRQFDLIISNPPYIEANDPHLNNLKYEPQLALTDFGDGLSCYRQIIANASNYLKPGGYLLLEHGYNQGLAIRQLFAAAGFSQINTLTDYAKCERISLAQLLS